MKRRFGDWHATATHHTPAEDAQGIFTGCVSAAIGIAILAHLGFLTGSTAGLALVISYATGFNVGLVYFLLNIPFYVLAVSQLGWAFTIKTFLGVGFLSLLTWLQPRLLQFGAIEPLAGAVVAGVLLGFGLLAMFRHRASLGGAGILALYLQNRFGWRAGLTQLAIDLLVLALAFFVVTPAAVMYSIIGAVVLNLFLAINHRNDRYVAR
ncbi:YitT family protein [Notoacmeibacter sp. MSK16QG-6]|uniref:YitT family protein n=1 Tax=Notoacmeibacter sp. MSK16QG-6 TaxID=2957982 RepID=UPI0020A1C2A6|nr:YitT family protein [Notoacmeibacter sp. MSK16QG-6]MCP1198638.1 YitT family protein [Notoacmeibacter sp. MSK16QG-6]